MGRASKNLHRQILAGHGKDNYKTMPEHKIKPAMNVAQMKGTDNAPAKTSADNTK